MNALGRPMILKHLAQFILIISLLTPNTGFSQNPIASSLQKVSNFCQQLLSKPLTKAFLNPDNTPVNVKLIENPDFAMEQAKSTQIMLLDLPKEQQLSQPIEYFRLQIPYVLRILDKLSSKKSSDPFWFVDKNGTKIPNGVSNIQQAIEYLDQQGQNAFLNNEATLAWFPEYVLDVLFLESYILALKFEANKKKPPESIIRSAYFYKIALNYKLKNGRLLWPTVANLDFTHFSEWQRGIRPLGLAKSFMVDFDGLQSSRYFFYGHDLAAHEYQNHYDLYMPYKKTKFHNSFDSFQNSFRKQVSEMPEPEQTFQNLFWFEAMHEGPVGQQGALLDAFAAAYIADTNTEVLVKELLASKALDSYKLVTRIQDPHDYADSFSASIKFMHSGNLDKLIKRQLVLFYKMIAQAHEDSKL